MKDKGHVIFENDSREHNLNIIGVRSKTAKIDEFGDQLLVAWKYQGVWHNRSYTITTYPGSHYLITKLLNPRGAAILVPGQYRGVYAIRKHNNKYEALCQTHGNVRVFRDGNRDNKFDLKPQSIMSGQYGINIHRSVTKGVALRVGSHSAGCQVFASITDFNEFMQLCYSARAKFGNSFTYTLIEDAT